MDRLSAAAPKHILKLRCITLDHRNAMYLQYNRLKEMINVYYGSSGKNKESVSTNSRYNRTRPDQFCNVLTTKLKKKYTIVNSTGLVSISDGLRLFPFGFR